MKNETFFFLTSCKPLHWQIDSINLNPNRQLFGNTMLARLQRNY